MADLTQAVPQPLAAVASHVATRLAPGRTDGPAAFARLLQDSLAQGNTPDMAEAQVPQPVAGMPSPPATTTDRATPPASTSPQALGATIAGTTAGTGGAATAAAGPAITAAALQTTTMPTPSPAAPVKQRERTAKTEPFATASAPTVQPAAMPAPIIALPPPTAPSTIASALEPANPPKAATPPSSVQPTGKRPWTQATPNDPPTQSATVGPQAPASPPPELADPTLPITRTVAPGTSITVPARLLDATAPAATLMARPDATAPPPQPDAMPQSAPPAASPPSVGTSRASTESPHLVASAGATAPPVAMSPAAALPIATTMPAATSRPNADTSSPTSPSATSPAAPLAPAIMRVTALDGGTQITVQLSPQSLGRVDIRIDRAPDGLAQVSLTVARPETLALLVRDQTQLNDALDRAGVPGDQRVLSFHLAPADAGSQTAPPVAASNGTQTQERSDHQQTAPDTAFQGHGGSSDRPTGDGTPRQGARPAFPFGTALPDDAGPVDWTPPSGWHRTGLNITA